MDLTAQHRPIRGEILAAWSRILDSGAFVSGSEVRGFEEEFAQACGVARCVAVSSGTDALTLALRALGLQAGDAVILPTNTFIATAEAVSNAGGVPVLVDCQESSANIDPRQVPEAVTDRVRGVIGVHLYGQPVDFQALNDVAANRGLWTLEDAAQAHLGRCRGRTVGGLGTAAAFSFYPAKNLGAPGEAGAVTTDDAALADEVRMLRDHGQRGKYHSELVGYNARMSELVAAALRIKLPLLPEWTEARRRVAARYRERLADHPAIALPAEPEWSRAVYHLFVVGVPERDRVKAELEAAGIGVGLHYPVPVHLQAAYRGLGYRAGDFPRSERNARSLLSLPMFAELTVDQVDHVCDTLRRAVDARPAGEVARG
ncbi:MAG: DegT/DnrJ/EryC1/StrS family aminotransferase [Actinomycetota bacterium]|nr:DegT/DnrJ/EryC1/StrS family aminotransferase [Actinomycetota bacterium]